MSRPIRKPWDIIKAQRDVLVNAESETVNQDGKTFQIRRILPQGFEASIQTGAPFYLISASGKTKDEAIRNVIVKADLITSDDNVSEYYAAKCGLP